jgi:hypothetical protein
MIDPVAAALVAIYFIASEKILDETMTGWYVQK